MCMRWSRSHALRRARRAPGRNDEAMRPSASRSQQNPCRRTTPSSSSCSLSPTRRQPPRFFGRLNGVCVAFSSFICWRIGLAGERRPLWISKTARWIKNPPRWVDGAHLGGNGELRGFCVLLLFSVVLIHVVCARRGASCLPPRARAPAG